MEGNLKIMLIDSGVNELRREFKKANIEKVNLHEFENGEEDSIGHGTAIAFLISRLLPLSTIYSLKLFDSNYTTTEDDLIDALNYIYENHEVDIIHISSGITNCCRKDELHDICRKLAEKNITIVSSFDNCGKLSYPAAFKEVIGVYIDRYCQRVSDYTYVENSTINILGYAGQQRLPWVNDSYKTVSGSSFASPYITGLVGKIIMNGERNHELIMEKLKEKASKIISFDESIEDLESIKLEDVKNIKSAITFPLNKEMDSLLGNCDLLNFNIVGAYDVSQFGRVGKKISDLVYGKSIADLKLESYLNIDWNNNFDTVILGHTELCSKALKIDYIKYFLDKCAEHKKNIYSFDDISSYEHEIEKIKSNGNKVMFYKLDESKVNINTFGSLNDIPCPVVGVFGTSPKQGKYNVQLQLRRRFFRDGYLLAQMGTEPSSLLFGMDFMYPFGYASNIDMNDRKEVYHINMELAKRVDNKEILIIGSQSQTVPYSFGNLGFYTFSQNNLLLAANPDAIILCVNPSDELDYIERTINYLKCFVKTHVIALVMYPFLKDAEWNIDNGNKEILPLDKLNYYRNRIEKETGIKTFINGLEEDDDELYELCIDYFAEEGQE